MMFCQYCPSRLCLHSSGLEELDLRGTHVTPRGLLHLMENLHNLKKLQNDALLAALVIHEYVPEHDDDDLVAEEKKTLKLEYFHLETDEANQGHQLGKLFFKIQLPIINALCHALISQI